MRHRGNSLLDELDLMPSRRDIEYVVESRASHIITGAINLINYINENYDDDTALELERRLLNSIRGRDTKKFSRAIQKIRNKK